MSLSLIFDTETTGIPLHPRTKDKLQPRVIEFACVVVDGDGKERDNFSTLINPCVKLSSEITSITGLTDEELQSAPTFADVWPEIERRIKSAQAVVAHNLPFDSTMIELECARIDATVRWPERMICTVQEHAEEWGKRPKLTELYQHIVGRPLAQKHRALDDVRALAELCIKGGVLS